MMLIRQCSWCRALLVFRTRVPFRLALRWPCVTHGICLPCRQRVFGPGDCTGPTLVATEPVTNQASELPRAS